MLILSENYASCAWEPSEKGSDEINPNWKSEIFSGISTSCSSE